VYNLLVSLIRVYHDTQFRECKVTLTVAFNANVLEYPRICWLYKNLSTPRCWWSPISGDVPLFFRRVSGFRLWKRVHL